MATTFTVIDVQEGHSTGSSALAAPAFAANPVTGDCVLVGVSSWKAGQGVTHSAPTDTASNTYVQIGTTLNHPSGNLQLSLWACVSATGGSSFVVTNHLSVSTYTSLVVWCVRPNVAIVSLGDVASDFSCSDENADDPTTSPAPPVADAFFLSIAVAAGTDNTLTAGTGWNTIANGFDSGMNGRAKYGLNSVGSALYTEYKIASTAQQGVWVDGLGFNVRSNIVAGFGRLTIPADDIPPITTGVGFSINGVQQTPIYGSVRLVESLGAVSNLEFDIYSGAGTYRPDLYDVVLWFDLTSFEQIFGGLVVDVTETGPGGMVTPTSIINHVAAQGFVVRAERAVINGEYPEGTLKEHIEQIIADTDNPLPQVTMDPAQDDGPTIPLKTWNYAYYKEALDEWSQQSGWPYEIDGQNVLRFMEPGTVPVAWNIYDANVHDVTVGDITVTRLHSEYANRIIVWTPTVLFVSDDPSEIDLHGLHVYVDRPDPETTTLDIATDLANNTLNHRRPLPRRVVFYDTYVAGPKPGRVQHITLSNRDVDNSFLITEVETYFTGTRIRRTVTAIEGTITLLDWRNQLKDWIKKWATL